MSWFSTLVIPRYGVSRVDYESNCWGDVPGTSLAWPSDARSTHVPSRSRRRSHLLNRTRMEITVSNLKFSKLLSVKHAYMHSHRSFNTIRLLSIWQYHVWILSADLDLSGTRDDSPILTVRPITIESTRTSKHHIMLVSGIRQTYGLTFRLCTRFRGHRDAWLRRSPGVSRNIAHWIDQSCLGESLSQYYPSWRFVRQLCRQGEM